MTARSFRGRGRWSRRTVLTTICLLVLLVASTVPAPAPTDVRAAAAPWTATFDGRPESPQPWNGDGWDVQVHSRDVDTWQQLEPMEAQHGADCSPRRRSTRSPSTTTPSSSATATS